MKLAVKSIGLGLALACLTFLLLPKPVRAQRSSQVRNVVRQNGNSTELVRVEVQDNSTSSVAQKPELHFAPLKFAASQPPAAAKAELPTPPRPQESVFDSRPEKHASDADLQQFRDQNASHRPELVRKADSIGGSDVVITPK